MFLQLLRYEIKKIFSISLVKKILLLLLVTNLAFCAYYAEDNRRVGLQVQSYLDKVLDLYREDPEKFYSEYERVQAEYEASDFFNPVTIHVYGTDVHPDHYLFQRAIKIVDQNRLYREKISEVIQQAEEIQLRYLNASGGEEPYAYRYQQEVEGVYRYCKYNVTLGDEQIFGWNEFFSYRTDYYLILAMVIILTVLTVATDYKSGFTVISGVCCFGRRHTVAAKYFSALILSAGITVLFFIGNLLSVGFVCGFSSPFVAIQSVESMILMPYDFSIFTTLWLALAIRLGVVALLVSLVFLVSVLTRGYFGGVLAGGGLVALGYYLTKIPVRSTAQWRKLNPWSLFGMDDYLSRLRTVDLFGQSVNLNYMVAAMFALAFVLGLGLSMLCYSTHIRSSPLNRWLEMLRHRRLKARGERRERAARKLSLLHYEIKKNKLFLLLLCAVLVFSAVLASDHYRYRESASEKIYLAYIDFLQGEYTEKKHDYLLAESSRCGRIIAEYDRLTREMESGLSEGKIEIPLSFLRDYNDALLRKDVVGELLSRARHLRDLLRDHGIEGAFVYETGYREWTQRGIPWLVLLAICLFACRQYLPEFERNSSGSVMNTIIQTTLRGRTALFCRKIALCLVGTGGLWILYRSAEWYCFSKEFQLPDFSASLYSLPAYEVGLFDISIGSYMILVELMNLAGVLMMATLCFCIGFWCKKSLTTYFAVAMVVFLPYFIEESGIKLFGYADQTLLISMDRAFREYPFWFGGVFFGAWILIASAVLVCTVQKARKGAGQ